MKSPFPGMDPFLELHWRDVHHRLCTYACDALQPQITPALKARVDERLEVEEFGEEEHRSIAPDVRVFERRRQPTAPSSAVAVADPLIVWQDEDFYQGYIEIVDPQQGGKLITVIEFLSPTNKIGNGRRKYRQKQQELQEAGVSLVGIDLVRSGAWTIQVSPDKVPPSYRAAPYHACVRRSWQGEKLEVYAFPLDQPLPTIRIPLRESDPADAKLNLQALIDQVYRNGAYEDMDYFKPLEPALAADQQAWLKERLQSRESS